MNPEQKRPIISKEETATDMAEMAQDLGSRQTRLEKAPEPFSVADITLLESFLMIYKNNKDNNNSSAVYQECLRLLPRLREHIEFLKTQVGKQKEN